MKHRKKAPAFRLWSNLQRSSVIRDKLSPCVTGSCTFWMRLPEIEKAAAKLFACGTYISDAAEFTVYN